MNDLPSPPCGNGSSRSALCVQQLVPPSPGIGNASGDSRRTASEDSDDLHRAIVESSRDCIKTLSLDGVLLSIADAARDIMCVTDVNALIGRSWIELWSGGDRAAANAAVHAAAAGGRGRFTGYLPVANSPRWWDVMVTPIRDRRGTIRQLLAVSRDVSEQQVTEQELRRHREQISGFLENAPIGLRRLAPDGTIQWANAAELEMFGYRRDDYIGHPVARFHVDREVVADMLSRLRRGETLRNVATQMLRHDGSRRDVLIDACGLWEDGRFDHAQCFTRDVTEQNQAIESSRRLAAIVESSEDAIIGVDLRGTIRSWNHGAEHTFGYSAATAVGQHLAVLLPSMDGTIEALIERVCRGERVEHYESVEQTREGRLVHVLLAVSPIRDAAGVITGVAQIARDITQRKLAELALRRSEAQIAAMIDAAPVGIYLLDGTMRIQRVNPKAMPAFGAIGDLVGRDLEEILRILWPAETAARLMERFRHTLATGEPYIERGFNEARSDRNQTEYYDWEIHRVTFPDGQHGIVCYFIDISAHVRAHREFAETASRLELALAAARLGFWRWDAATDVVDFSDRAAEIFGIPAGPFMTWTKMQGLLDGGDGERARVSVEHAVASRSDYSIEYRVNRPAGDQVWVAAMGRGVYDGDRVVAMLGVVQDITDRKRAETERAALLLQEKKAREEAEALSEAARALIADLDLQATVQKATDVATRLTGAKFGAFFYNVVNERQESYMLYTLSGAPRAAFDKFGLPRNTPLFSPTFNGAGVVRLPDVMADSRYGTMAPHHGMPKGHLPVRSYLAVPVVSRSGEVLGGMFFGHPDAGVFTERAERIAVGIAAQASIAMDNAKLYARVQSSVDRLNFSLSALALGNWSWDAATDMLTISERMADIFGLPVTDRVTHEQLRACVHPHDRERARMLAEEAARHGVEYATEYRVVHPTAGARWVAMKGHPTFDDQRRVTGMMGVAQDITERKTAELHLRCQRDVLEQIVRGAPLAEVLETLTCWVERAVHRNVVATILLMDADGAHLRPAAGKSAPAAWSRYIDGMAVGPCAGSCGTAAYRGERVIVSDVTTDPLWANFQSEAVKHGIRACWSTPIVSSTGRVMGTFAIYYPQPGQPEPGELEVVDVVTRTAAIAIERKLSEQALKESRARLERHAEILEQCVEERTAKLRETIGELEAFSYSVSHDMRAPLRAMQGYADRLLKHHARGLDPDALQYLTRINKNSQRLELLVRDVLAYSKVAKSDIELVRVDLDVFVPALVAQMPELHRDGVLLMLQRPLPAVRAHEAYLSQIFTNLLNNAVKFASPRRAPQIEIVAAESADAPDMVTISVSDNGIGIATEHFERIFQIFGRVYPDKQFDGTGIGLAIVKKAVQRMGGTVTVSSELDKGSCFAFTLKKA